jgi:hypothetical protein
MALLHQLEGNVDGHMQHARSADEECKVAMLLAEVCKTVEPLPGDAYISPQQLLELDGVAARIQAVAAIKQRFSPSGDGSEGTGEGEGSSQVQSRVQQQGQGQQGQEQQGQEQQGQEQQGQEQQQHQQQKQPQEATQQQDLLASRDQH